MNTHTPTPDHTFFNDHIKPHAPAYITSVATSLLFLSSMIFNYSGQSQHTKDILAAQGQEIADTRAQLTNLQTQVNQDGVVLAVLNSFEIETDKRLGRIEALLLQDIRAHVPRLATQ